MCNAFGMHTANTREEGGVRRHGGVLRPAEGCWRRWLFICYFLLGDYPPRYSMKIFKLIKLLFFRTNDMESNFSQLQSMSSKCDTSCMNSCNSIEAPFKEIPKGEDVLFQNVKMPHTQPIIGNAKDYFSQAFQHANSQLEPKSK